MRVFALLLLCFIISLPVSGQSDDQQWQIGKVTGFEDISYSHPALIDYNPDLGAPNNVLDVVSGADTGTLRYQLNLGDNNTDFRFESSEAAVFSDTFSRAAVTATDYNGDNLEDLLVGDANGDVYLYLNEGDNFILNLTLVSEVKVESYAKPVALHLNDDTILDILVGTGDGSLIAFINTGSWDNPIFEKNENIFSGFQLGTHLAPYPIDPDDDGVYSLVIGSENSGISILQAVDEGGEFPEYNHIPYRNSANPIGDIGEIQTLRNLTPMMVDLNEDGFLDLVFGTSEGDFQVYYNFGYDFTTFALDLPLTQLIIIAVLIAIVSIGLTVVIYRRFSGKKGKPLFLMIVQDIGIVPFQYEFTEELVKDTNLAGGAITGIQSIINEITSSDLNSMEAGDNRILISRSAFTSFDGDVQVLLWSTEDDPRLRNLSQDLGDYIAKNLESYFVKGSFDSAFNNVITSKIEELFDNYI